MVALVKVCNFTNIRLHHGCVFVNFLKLFKTYFDELLDFPKVHKNTGEKLFSKYFSADGCSVKTNTINCDNNKNAMFPNTRAFAFTRQASHEMKFQIGRSPPKNYRKNKKNMIFVLSRL